MFYYLKNKLKKNRFVRYLYFGGRDLYRRVVGPTSKELDYKIGLVYNKLNQREGMTADFLSRNKIIEGTKDEKKNRIAFVTILPKDNSGIAVTGLYSFLDSEVPIDVFSPSSDCESFIYNSYIMETNRNIRLFDVNDLVLATKIFNYKKIVVAIGNSSHHFYIIPLLERLKEENFEQRVVLYIHDVILWNVLFAGQHHSCNSFRREIEDIYKSEEVILPKVNDQWSLQQELVKKYSLSGARVFVSKFGIKNFLTNSKVATEMIQADLNGTNQNVSYKKIFLPLITQFTYREDLIDPEIIGEKEKGVTYIGSFGVLSDAKRIDDLLKVFSRFADKNINLKLVLAGWGAKQYVQSHQNLIPSNVIVIDSPNDSELVFLMKYVDFAIQLRRFKTGESSGVVPMLLELDKTVLVSNIGSFREFGSEVLHTSDDDLESLEKDIIDMVSLKKVPSSEAKKEFVKKHSIKKFSSDLYEYYA